VGEGECTCRFMVYLGYRCPGIYDLYSTVEDHKADYHTVHWSCFTFITGQLKNYKDVVINDSVFGCN
jgi:hypothetical protein